MLADYNAKAVADVMGIAFADERDCHPGAGYKRARATRTSKAPVADRFVINVNRHPVRILGLLGTGRGFAGAGKTQRAALRHRHLSAVTLRPPSPELIEKAVEHGLPRLALRHVAEQIAGADKAKVPSLEWVIVPKTTLERRTEQLSPLESERTERVARLFVHARRALGSDAEARAFMTAPHPLLDQRTPIDTARTDLGTRRTEQILNALEYGLAV